MSNRRKEVKKQLKLKNKKKSKKIQKTTDKKILLISLILVISFSILVFAATFLPDLSDTFDDFSFNTAKWRFTTSITGSAGAPAHCPTATSNEAGQPYYTQVAGCSANPFSTTSTRTVLTCLNTSYGEGYDVGGTSNFTDWDVYINSTRILSITQASGSITSSHTLFIRNDTNTSVTSSADQTLFTNSISGVSTDTNVSQFRIHITDTPTLQTADLYIDGNLNTTKGLSLLNSWYVCWENKVQISGSAFSSGTSTTNAFNYSTFLTPIIFTNSTVSFNENVSETSSQAFNETFTANPNEFLSILGVNLNYDGENYPGEFLQINSTGVLSVNAMIDVPAVSSNTTFNFFWDITYLSPSGITTIQSDTHQQLVSDTFFGQCGVGGAGSVVYLNATTYEEGTFEIKNSSLQAFFTYWLGSGTTFETGGYSNLSASTPSHKFCFTPSSETIFTDMAIDYYYTDNTTLETFPIRSYFLDGAELTSTTEELPLYMITDNSTTLTTFLVIDESYNPVINAFVLARRWNPITDQFTLVAMCSTDFSGHCSMYIRQDDAWHTYSVVKDNQVLFLSNPLIETQTERTLIISLIPDDPFQQFNNIQFDLSWNNNTNIFTLDWTDITGLAATGCLRVKQISDNSVLSYQCSTTAAAVLSYQITQNGTFVGQALFTQNNSQGTFTGVVDQIIVTIGKADRFVTIGLRGLVPGLLLIGTLTIIGLSIAGPFGGATGLIVSILAVFLIGFINFPPTVIYSIIAICILITFLASRRNQ